MPPVAPMLSKSVAKIPLMSCCEPKWTASDRSFSGRRRGRIRQPQRAATDALLPELVAAATAELPPRCVIDGEIRHRPRRSARLRGAAATSTPPIRGCACWQAQLRRSSPSTCWLSGDRDLTAELFEVRRAALTDAMTGCGPSFHVTPATTDVQTARRWFEELEVLALMAGSRSR